MDSDKYFSTPRTVYISIYADIPYFSFGGAEVCKKCVNRSSCSVPYPAT
jgi:hypothetical protein